MVTFYKLVWPILNKMQGLTPKAPLMLSATLTTPVRKQPGRVEYQRGILSRNCTGRVSGHHRQPRFGHVDLYEFGELFRTCWSNSKVTPQWARK